MKTILEMHSAGEINVLGSEKEAIYKKGDEVYCNSRKLDGEVQGSFIYEDKMKYTVSLKDKGLHIDGNLTVIDEDDLSYLAYLQNEDI